MGCKRLFQLLLKNDILGYLYPSIECVYVHFIKSMATSTYGIDTTRLAFLPIENPELEKYYQEQKNVFWTAQEIPLTSTDREEFDNLDAGTKQYVEFLLFLFSQLDGIVNENLVEHFKKETSVLAKECSMVYAIFEAMEWGHNETYSLLIKTYIRDSERQAIGLDAISHFPAIRAIADWAYQWMTSELPLTERVIAFASIEGIIFSSAFAGIYWLKRRNILHGLTKANEWIARDEAIHTRFAIALYDHLVVKWPRRNGHSATPLPEERVHSIIKSGVGVAENFTRTAMNTNLVGLSADDLVDYIKCTADQLAVSLGYSKIYNVINPFDWMIVISLPNKTNFFEQRVTEYAREGSTGNDQFIFDLNALF